MIHAHNAPRWGGICDRCLASFPIIECSREEYETQLCELGYELRDDRQVWCLACSRRAREVKRATNARGVRRPVRRR